MKLDRGVVLKGRVLDSTGQPLKGVVVDAREGGDRRWSTSRSSVSRTDGTFEFAPLNPGSYEIGADGRLRDEKGEINSREVQAVFVKQGLDLDQSTPPPEVTLRAIPHVTLEFEWIDRRQKKGPVSYYGTLMVDGHMQLSEGELKFWDGETQLITRDNKQYLTIKVPANLTRARLLLLSDTVVRASYEDENQKVERGPVELGDVTKPVRRQVFADEPKQSEPPR